MGNNIKGFDFKKYATPRIIGGIAIVIIVLWALSIIFGSPDGSSSKRVAERPHDAAQATSHSGAAGGHQPADAAHRPAPDAAAKGHATASAGTAGHGAVAVQKTTEAHGTPSTQGTAASRGTVTREASPGAPGQKTAGGHGAPATQGAAGHGAPAETAGAATARQQSSAAPRDAQTDTHAAAGQPPAQHDTSTTHTMPTTINTAAVHKPMPKGVAFVKAAIKPLDFELEERWWGWRPNDIIDLTDNVNNFQMGVLEVTRRTTVALAERISRTGTTDAFDENLEQAMNWFMIKASSYWFPSAESKYRDGLEEMQVYLEKLKAGNATFYTRTDNLIPLLSSFEDLLGSCDENLVKQTNDDGTPISSFAVDNYFYYTQGVASAMATVLEAAHHDFLLTLESRNATELLHHAIISCQQATKIEPWIILDRKLDSIFANHRANMAAPISHARFYLGQLIKTLST